MEQTDIALACDRMQLAEHELNLPRQLLCTVLCAVAMHRHNASCCSVTCCGNRLLGNLFVCASQVQASLNNEACVQALQHADFDVLQNGICMLDQDLTS
jgi:hypothetical protein